MTVKKHLIVASYDGISTHYCGVGTIIRNTIQTLSDFAESKKIKVSLAYISTAPNGTVFNLACYKDSAALVEKTGGHLIPLCNGTFGLTESDMWKSFPQWEYACASLATSLNLILEDKDDNIVMLHDTPFLLFSKFKQQIFKENLRCFYLPHSSGLNHVFGKDEWRKERIQRERNAFKLIQSDKSSRLLSEGKNFGKHLADAYGVSLADDQYLTNGLYFDRYREGISKRYNNNDLKQFGIDIKDDSRIIFSWGRSSIAKGLKELAEAWQDIAGKLSNYYLIIQAPNNSGENDYYNLLRNYSQTIPNFFLIDDFNPQIWQTVLRCENTDVVCIPSLMDPNPHTAIEAKLFSVGMNYVIIGSKTDGVKDTFSDSECFWVNPYDKKEFSDTIICAVSLNKIERKRMSDSNSKSMPNFDYAHKFQDFLKGINFI